MINPASEICAELSQAAVFRNQDDDCCFDIIQYRQSSPLGLLPRFCGSCYRSIWPGTTRGSRSRVEGKAQDGPRGPATTGQTMWLLVR